MLRHIFDSIEPLGKNLLNLIKWLLISVAVGVVVGGVSTLFARFMTFVTGMRTDNPWIFLLLPLGGIMIVALYRAMKYDNARGTNTVLASIHSGDRVSFKMAPFIFISTVISHLFGASVGREGAALQLGGSMASMLGKIFRLDESDRKIIVMCGMSAAFAALFGTPMAAAIFAIEVVNVGVMYYAALVPCIFAALVASQFAAGMGIHPESFTILEIPELTVMTAGKTVILALIVAAVSVIFCMMLHESGAAFKKFFKNPYVRIVVGSVIIILITIVIGTNDYMGAGIDVIDRAMEGDANIEAFILKMLLTSLAIGCGFKGGEIVPTFFIGATLGCCLGYLLKISPSMAAAVGMVAMFCGVTNCPISSTLIAFELFGYKAVPFFLIGNSVSYLMSGYYGLYEEQIISLSKSKLGDMLLKGSEKDKEKDN